MPRTYSITEDPATGADVAGLAGYLWERDQTFGRWVVHQGLEMGRTSELHIELLGARGRLETVRIGGMAVRMGVEACVLPITTNDRRNA